MPAPLHYLMCGKVEEIVHIEFKDFIWAQIIAEHLFVHVDRSSDIDIVVTEI